jgi:hypothetical protein
MDETSATDVYCPREECHTQGLLVCYTLKGADKVSPFEILDFVSVYKLIKKTAGTNL